MCLMAPLPLPQSWASHPPQPVVLEALGLCWELCNLMGCQVGDLVQRQVDSPLSAPLGLLSSTCDT